MTERKVAVIPGGRIAGRVTMNSMIAAMAELDKTFATFEDPLGKARDDILKAFEVCGRQAIDEGISKAVMHHPGACLRASNPRVVVCHCDKCKGS